MAAEAVRIPIEAVDNTKAAFNSVNKNLKQTADNTKKANGGMRLMKGGAQQLGYQMQDVAVQLQGGQNALLVLGQQGSQVASIFGPGGALLGAVIAIGAAVAGPLYSALTGSTSAMADLTEEAGKATAAFNTLNRIQKEQRKIAVGAQAADLYKVEREALERVNVAQAEFVRLSKFSTSALDQIEGGAGKGAIKLAQLQKQIQDSGTEAYDARIALDALRDSIDPSTEARKAVEALKLQAQQVGLSAIEAEALKMANDGVSQSMIDQYRIAALQVQSAQNVYNAQQSLIQQNKELEASEVSAAAARYIAAEQSVQKLRESLLSKEEAEKLSYARRFVVVSDALAANHIQIQEAEQLITAIKASEAARQKKVSDDKLRDEQKARKDAIDGIGGQLMALDSNNKKVFAMQKAFRIGQAIMDAHAAYGNALAAPYPPPIPQILAGAALGMGLANVAQIKAQSFEGGGFTGRGARAGGLDGKGGRMAMVHPNESIIDHTKGGAGGITVINNVDARGSGADVDQKIKSAMAQSSQQTIMTIQDLMRRRRFA
jgi:hypothetical protein